VLPASLTLGIVPGAEDNSGKVPSTAWVRSLVTTTGGSLVPTNRSITINGTSYDLSSNRSWSIDTGVLTASAGSGISVSVVNQNLNIVNTGLLTGTAGAGISVSTVNQNLNIVNTGLLSATAGSGITVSTVNQNLNIVNTGLLTASSGLGISVSTVGQNLNIVNTGILTASAGSGISLSVVSQNLNIVNTGILTATAGAGISLSVVSGNLNIVNTITNNNQLDNGAGYATTSYVTTQINNLVDAAPGTLDTLNELAAALGDDPNFATTVAASIGTKQAQLNGTGFVKVTGTTVSYDNSTYLTTGTAASTYVSLTGSYSNPLWITALGWGKITGTPTTISGYGITNAYTDAQIQNFFNGANAITGYNKSNWDTAYGWGNHASVGYLTGITSSQVTTALGYTPYNSSNPSGYITSSALSSYLPLSGGTVSGPLTINTTSDIIANGDTFRMKGGGGSAEFIWYRNYSGDPSHPGFVIINRSGTTTFSHNSNGGGTSISGNFSAANFSGSSSGTNTGDQTLSSLGGVPTSGYAFGTSFTLGTMYVGTGEQFTPTTLLGVYSNGYAYKFPVAGVQAWLGLGSLAYSSATIPTNNNQLANGAGYITSSGNISGYAMSLNGYGQQIEYTILTGPANGPVIKVRYDGATANRYIDIGSKDGNGVYSEGLKIYNGGALTMAGSTVWTAANLTNLNQLINGPGYLTSLPSHNHDGVYMKTNRTLDTINTIDNGGDRYNPSVNNPTNEHYAVLTYGNGGNVTGQLATHFVSGQLYSRGYNSSWSSWLKYVVENGGTWGISISGNAATLGGYSPNQTGGVNTIVQRDANGYIQNSYFYMSGGGSERNSSGLSYIAGFNSSDYYVRSYNSTAVASFLGLGTMAYASTSSYVPYGNWGTTSGLNDYKLYLRTNGDNNHYLWNASDDWEELNAYEGTGFRITSVGGSVGVLYVYGSSNGGYTYSPYSFRAPIFYDSQDINYYVDPNGTSRLVQLNLGTTNTQIKSIDGVGYLRIYGSSSNFLGVGPYDNNGWVYFENSGNSNGIYFNSPGRYAFDTVDVTPYNDAENSLGNGSYRWAQVYTSGWLRQYGAQGMYNQDYGTHFYSSGGGSWNVTGSGGNVELVFRSNHQSTIRGYVYADTGNSIGFLNNSGGWSLRMTSGGDAYVSGYLYVNGAGTSSSIFMQDSDEGQREIHCNSNRIGFLTQAGSWGAYCDDAGNWFANNLSGTNTGDQTNISGNSGTTSQRSFDYLYASSYLESGGAVYGTIFYDNNDRGYYLDPNA
jgi:uncharacterized protein YfkK (UPF0435 family)